MAIIVNTPNPAGLLAQIKQDIDEKHIETWSYDADGDLPTPQSSGPMKRG